MSQLSRGEDQKKAHVQGIVDRLAGDLSTEGLYKSIHNNLTITDISDLFASGSVGFYKIAQDIIRKEISNPELHEELVRHIATEKDGVCPLLRVLATLNLPESKVLEDALFDRAIHSDLIISEAAAKVIALRYKERIPDLLAQENIGIRYGLNYAQDAKLIEPLLTLWGIEDDPECTERPPVGLGLLVTQYALAELWERKPHLAYSVARAYGYIDDAPEFPDTETLGSYCELLRSGFMTVDPVMFGEDVSYLRQIEGQFLRTLMPWSTKMTGSVPEGFDPEEPLWQLLFLSAVRESEATNFDIKRDELPYTQNGQENIRWAEFSYTPLSYGRRELLTRPIQAFNQAGIRSDLLPQYVLEHAVCRLERDAKAQEEQLLFFESRWALVAKNGTSPSAIENFVEARES